MTHTRNATLWRNRCTVARVLSDNHDYFVETYREDQFQKRGKRNSLGSWQHALRQYLD